MRPSWDEVWAEVAIDLSRRSLCSRAKVGAVITDTKNRIVSTGYNGPPQGFIHGDAECVAWCNRATDVLKNAMDDVVATITDYSNCPSLHAEANALMAADRSSWQGGTIYVTGHVCSDCAKLIANSGLIRVVVSPDGRDRSYRNYDQTYAFLTGCGITVEVLQ